MRATTTGPKDRRERGSETHGIAPHEYVGVSTPMFFAGGGGGVGVKLSIRISTIS